MLGPTRTLQINSIKIFELVKNDTNTILQLKMQDSTKILHFHKGFDKSNINNELNLALQDTSQSR